MTPSKNFDPKYKREMNTDNVDGFGLGVGVTSGSSLAITQQGQGVAALLVMLVVLCFIFAYCCWGAPFCRSFCRRQCCCRLEGSEIDPRFGNSDQAMVATPTIILLPHGRMLVVDGTIFTQLQADTTGLDLVELGENVIRSQRNSRYVNRHQLQNSQGSILEMDAETPSKDSIGSIGFFPPPTYESIYGKDEGEMPPSYSDIILHRFANMPYEIELQDYSNGKEEIEMRSLENCSHIINNPLNTITTYHPYATITSFSSQRLSRPNISRNSTFINSSRNSDNLYIENELDNFYNVPSSNCIRMTNLQQTAVRGFISNEELHRRYSESQIARNQLNNVVNLNDYSQTNETSQTSRNTQPIETSDITNTNANNEIISNRTREENGNIRLTNDGLNVQPSSSGGQSTSIEISNNNSVETQRHERHRPLEDVEDENKNFMNLADIRESRV
ncbi:probable serine/threonine-protein kinase tsuA [Chelonus insularis]|uniref:probable serine/threonine-protein kinase tsuA n=1 Tax=Chelonus insularis TaxID=460826 RepID=UPI001588F45B|nr:probable serine/threonine-protein kinase tsuA [Chelonus insularis]